MSAEAWQHGLARGAGDAAKAERQQYKNSLGGVVIFFKENPPDF